VWYCGRLASDCSTETGFFFGYAILDKEGNVVVDSSPLTAITTEECVARNVNRHYARPDCLGLLIRRMKRKLHFTKLIRIIEHHLLDTPALQIDDDDDDDTNISNNKNNLLQRLRMIRIQQRQQGRGGSGSRMRKATLGSLSSLS